MRRPSRVLAGLLTGFMRHFEGRDEEKVGLQLHLKEIDVPSGEIYLRTGIYDLNASTAGALGVPLSAAPLPRAQ